MRISTVNVVRELWHAMEASNGNADLVECVLFELRFELRMPVHGVSPCMGYVKIGYIKWFLRVAAAWLGCGRVFHVA